MRKLRKQYTSDKRMLKLLEILKTSGVGRYEKQFCDAINLRTQNLSGIKNHINHFTPEHIEKAIRTFKTNANWIFGISDTIFNENELITNKSILKNSLTTTKQRLGD